MIKIDMALHPGREAKAQLRFILTNVTEAPWRIHERIYCSRGYTENRIKELKAGVNMDRTSCSQFVANRFRVLMAIMAMALPQELSGQGLATLLARAQLERMQLRPPKLRARGVRTAQRVQVHLPRAALGRDA